MLLDDLLSRLHLGRNEAWDLAAVLLALLTIGSATYFLALALETV